MSPSDDLEVPIVPWPAPTGSAVPELHSRTGALHGEALMVEAKVLGLLDLLDSIEPEDDQALLIHDLALTIDNLDRTRSLLKTVSEAVEEAFCRLLPFQTTSVGFPDCAALIPRWGGSRTEWDSKTLRDDVRSKVLARFSLDEETEVGAAAADVFDLMETVVSVTGSNVKTSGLKRLGLDPDDYSEKVAKAPSVQVVR